MEPAMTRVSIICLLALCIGALAPAQSLHPLPGTEPLSWQGDLSERMMDGAHRFVERKLDESLENRQRFWQRDFSSRQAYEKSVEDNRRRFMTSIGVVDPRVPAAIERFAQNDDPAMIADAAAYRIYQIR